MNYTDSLNPPEYKYCFTFNKSNNTIHSISTNSDPRTMSHIEILIKNRLWSCGMQTSFVHKII